METTETAPNVNPQRMDQDFTLVFTGITCCCHCPGNRYSQADVFSGTVEVDETYIGGQWKIRD